MAYRNKTYVAFASEDIHYYRLMQAWVRNAHIDFNFVDAHDINTARDSSLDETIRRRLRERLANSKQAVVLLSDNATRKSGIRSSFLYYELFVLSTLNIPIVFVNLNQSRFIDQARIPGQLDAPLYSICVSFQPKIIQFALDDYVSVFNSNQAAVQPRRGPHYYLASVYAQLGL